VIVGKAEVSWIAGIDEGEAADAGGEVIVRRGPVDKPPSAAHAVARTVPSAAMERREVGVFDAEEVEFGGLGRTDGLFVVLPAEDSALRQGSEGDHEQQPMPHEATVQPARLPALPAII
jgi:hypothetical protein